jgi:phospholipid/cholesterol/gamma-HCH transport system ATP-binding protein
MTVILEKQRVVLQLQDAVLTTDPYARTVSDKLNLEVCGGDLFLIRVEQSDQISALADACAGMIQPLQGAVYFLGRDWQDLPPDLANALRGRIGQVFIRGNWIHNISVMENILLPQLYHTHRFIARVLEEAAELVERFGLPGVPEGLPGDFTPSDLQRAACVRAFLGRPALILLREPTDGLRPEFSGALIQTIRDARYRGAAVIWMTMEGAVWDDATIPASHRYRLVARNLMEVDI